jgi:hypothetical protein
MILYILKRIEYDYDEVVEFVIQAESPKQARLMASSEAADEGSKVWIDAKLSSCKELKPGKKPGIIVKHYRPG